MGNVRAVVSDVKVPTVTDGAITNLTADVVSATDYYPFGMQMPGRSFSSNSYRYGFNNGSEKDDEIYGEGNSYTAKYWQYDPRLGRRWNVDPVTYPWQSSYAAFNNAPIVFVDPLGLYGTRKEARRARRTARKSGLEVGKVYKSGDEFGFAGNNKGQEAAHYFTATNFDKPERKSEDIPFGFGSKENLWDPNRGGFMLTSLDGVSNSENTNFKSAMGLGSRKGFISGTIAGGLDPTKSGASSIFESSYLASNGFAKLFMELFGSSPKLKVSTANEIIQESVMGNPFEKVPDTIKRSNNHYNPFFQISLNPITGGIDSSGLFSLGGLRSSQQLDNSVILDTAKTK